MSIIFEMEGMLVNFFKGHSLSYVLSSEHSQIVLSCLALFIIIITIFFLPSPLLSWLGKMFAVDCVTDPEVMQAFDF